MNRICAWAVVSMLLLAGRPSGQSVLREHPSTQTICSLVNKWVEYNRKPVRIRAIYRVGAEQQWLFDPDCSGEKYLAAVEFRSHTRGAKKKLDQLVAKDGRAWAVFEGIFYGPEPNKDVDPKLPAPLRKRLEESPRHYGHLGAFDTMIKVSRVVTASAVPADTP